MTDDVAVTGEDRERVARAIAATVWHDEPDQIDQVWPDFVGQAEAAIAASQPVRVTDAMVERALQSVDYMTVYAEARKRMLADMTGADIDEHLVRVASEHAARAILTAALEADHG